MLNKLMLISLMVMVLCSAPILAYEVGDTWPATVAFSAPDAFESTACQDAQGALQGTAQGEWTYLGDSEIAHPISGGSVHVHEFVFQGPGSGSFELFCSFDCYGEGYWDDMVMIELIVDFDTFNPIMARLVSETLTEWEWDISGDPRYYDDWEGTYTATVMYDPYYPDFDWPLETGKTWNMTLDHSRIVTGYWEGWIGDYGTFSISLDTGSGGAQSITAIVGEEQSINGCISFPIEYSGILLTAWCSMTEFYSMRQFPDFRFDMISPEPTATPVPTGTPTATPTANPVPQVEVDVAMPYHFFFPGAPCEVIVTVNNPYTDPLTGHPLYLLLNIHNDFLFAPTFTTTPCSLFNEFHSYPHGKTEYIVIPEFTWPTASGSGDATWYAAILEPDGSAIYGVFGQRSFAWSE